MNITDEQIQEGKLLLDVEEIAPSQTTPFIMEKVAEINEDRKKRSLPEIDFEIEEIEQPGTAFLRVWVICTCGQAVNMNDAEQVQYGKCSACLGIGVGA